MGKAKTLIERLFEGFFENWKIQKWGDLVFFIDGRIDLYIPRYECGDCVLLDGVKVEVSKTSSKNIITIDVGRDCYYFIYRIAKHCEVKVSSQIGKVFRTESGTESGLCGVFILFNLDELDEFRGTVEIDYGEDVVIYNIDEGIVETYYKSDLEPVKEVFYFSVP